jgi:type VI secretion system protein ImpC
VCLSERALDAMLARGIMPLVSFKDRDAVRLIRLQSIADPPAALGG